MTKYDYFLRNHYLSREEKKWCSDYCTAHWQEDTEHILRIAEDAVNLKFIFDLRWDMERTYEPVIFEENIDWAYMPKDDVEFIYQLNRHRFWVCLGQAYAMTGDEKFAKAFTEQLVSWIDANPLNEETKLTSWRTIEAGLRGENWTKAIRYFESSEYLTDEVVEKFCDVLKVHAEYIIQSYSPFRLQSNWGVIENHGLFEIALALPQSEETKAYIQIALSRLEDEMQLQVMGDGVHWEQSPMYHNEVLHCYLEVVRLAKEYDVTLPDTLIEGTKAMVRTNLIWKKPNHCQIMQGDSDETDVRDLITYGAYLFKDSTLKFGGYPHIDFENVWHCSEKEIREYEMLSTCEPSFKVKNLIDSGNCYIRSDWSEQADFIHFRCGTLGGGHGHADKLHIDLVMNGEDILMDSGRYHYVDGENRYWFKGSLAHNTVAVDKKDYMVCEDAWATKGLTSSTKLHHCQKGKYHFMQAGHQGYIGEGVFVNRKVIVIEPKLYVVVDELYAKGKHDYTQYFHFNNEGEVEQLENKVRYKENKVIADLWVMGEDKAISLQDTKLSRNYNQKEPNKTLEVHTSKEGFASYITVISGYDKEADIKGYVRKIPVESVLRNCMLSDEQAEAVEIVKDGKVYVVVIGHQEIAGPCDLFKVGDHVGLGNVVVFEEEKATVLNW